MLLILSKLIINQEIKYHDISPYRDKDIVTLLDPKWASSTVPTQALPKFKPHYYEDFLGEWEPSQTDGEQLWFFILIWLKRGQTVFIKWSFYLNDDDVKVGLEAVPVENHWSKHLFLEKYLSHKRIMQYWTGF